jgi:hypothetical protein
LGISWSDSGSSHQRIYLAKHAFPHPFLWRSLWSLLGAFGLKETSSYSVTSPLGYLLGSCLSRRKSYGTWSESKDLCISAF